MISKIALILVGFATSFTSSFSYVPTVSYKPNLKMSASQNYLQNLKSDVFPMNKRPLIKVYDELQLKNAEVYTTKTEVHIDTIYMNIYKLDNIFFNRNAMSVVFRLKDVMQDVFYCENEKIFKLSNTTRITSKSFRKFIVAEMDPNIDAILYSQGNAESI